MRSWFYTDFYRARTSYPPYSGSGTHSRRQQRSKHALKIKQNEICRNVLLTTYSNQLLPHTPRVTCTLRTGCFKKVADDTKAAARQSLNFIKNKKTSCVDHKDRNDMWPTAASQFPQQFPSYSNRKCKKSPFSSTAAHIFVSPGDAPAIITQCVAWMERQFNACQTPRSM